MLSLALIFITLVSVTLLFDQYDWDRQFTSWFYHPDQGWMLVDTQPWQWLYRYGTIPGLLFTLGAAGGLYLSFVKPKMASWRRYAFIIVLTSVVGGGILVNGILKDYWGRTRPRQIEEFGGKWEYREIRQLGIPGKGKSFPCGHCTISYLFVSLLIFYPKSRWFSLIGAGLGLGYGILMSIARVGQGGHFPTDTFWALGIVLLMTTFFYYFIFPPASIPFAQTVFDKKRKISLSLGLLLVLGVMVFFFLTRRPVFEDHKHGLALSSETQTIHLRTNIAWDNITIHVLSGKPAFVQTLVRGFGWPDSSHQVNIQRTPQAEGIFYIDYQLISQGYFSERNIDMSLYLPERLKNKVIAVQ